MSSFTPVLPTQISQSTPETDNIRDILIASLLMACFSHSKIDDLSAI